MTEFHVQKPYIEVSDQYLKARPSRVIPGEIEIEMHNAVAGHQAIRLSPDDVATLGLWLKAESKTSAGNQ